MLCRLPPTSHCFSFFFTQLLQVPDGRHVGAVVFEDVEVHLLVNAEEVVQVLPPEQARARGGGGGGLAGRERGRGGAEAAEVVRGEPLAGLLDVLVQGGGGEAALVAGVDAQGHLLLADDDHVPRVVVVLPPVAPHPEAHPVLVGEAGGGGRGGGGPALEAAGVGAAPQQLRGVSLHGHVPGTGGGGGGGAGGGTGGGAARIAVHRHLRERGAGGRAVQAAAAGGGGVAQVSVTAAGHPASWCPHTVSGALSPLVKIDLPCLQIYLFISLLQSPCNWCNSDVVTQCNCFSFSPFSHLSC